MPRGRPGAALVDPTVVGVEKMEAGVVGISVLVSVSAANSCLVPRKKSRMSQLAEKTSDFTTMCISKRSLATIQILYKGGNALNSYTGTYEFPSLVN